MRLLNDLKTGESLTHIMFIVAFALIAVGSVAIILFCVMYVRDKNQHRDIANSSNTLRIYVVDVKNDSVTYFNSSRLRRRKTSSITSFYNQFRSRDREALINWIGNLLDSEIETPNFLEIKVYIKSKKQNLSSILEVKKIDFEKQLIYLESNIIEYANKPHKRGERTTFNKQETILRKIQLKCGKGNTFSISFFNKTTKTNDVSQLIYIDLKNLMLSFLDSEVFIAEDSYGKFLVSNFNLENKDDVYDYIDLLRTKINRLLQIKSYMNDIDYTIGVIRNDVQYRAPEVVVKNVMALAELAKDDERQVLFFNEAKTLLTEEQGQQYRSDVEEIIQDNKLRYLFQPIYDIDRGKIIGYNSTVIPVESFFKNMDDLKNYALRTDDDKALFSTIVKNTISRFVQEKNEYGVHLVFSISFNEIEYVNRSLGHIPGVSDSNIILLLKEKDLSSLPEEFGEEGLVNAIRSFKSKGYEVALEIDDDILTLSPKVYSACNYFSLSVANHMSKKDTGSKLPSFQSLIEKLLCYEKPLVATDIQTWDILELVYKLGISRVCSNAITLPAENIMPLPKKIVMKINNLKS